MESYSAQPLQLNEIAEVIALDVEAIPRVNIERRFQEPEDILKICSALITFSGEEVKDTVTIQLAHFSVKEYLVSDRIRHGKAKAYSCQETEANFLLANDCIAYLLQFDELDSVTYSTYSEFPLSSYAALYWFQHVRIVEKNSSAATNLLTIEFLLTRCNALLNRIRLHDPDGDWAPMFREDMESVKNVLPPLYYASLLGLPQSVRMLLDKGEDINARAGYYGNALQAASSRNHGEIVQILLDNGVDVNTESGFYGNALQAASCGGHDRLVQMLLDNGADVNANGGYFRNALLAASRWGHDRVVETLLRKGACVSAQTGEYDNAL
ncbi:hypothetical protein OEA41_002594 [Lepraria neglecta]|uniref:Ankyrin n=1 Tax=Lepraria neglecta TaxID=209136 RepID=A0AAD9ZFD9_9LECA|nr:hypothetical protein OEA41_002594 [Lepraria neglecta]